MIRWHCRLGIEELESRALLSTATAFTAVPADWLLAAVTNPTPVGYTPAQIRHAYGFDAVSFLAGNINNAGAGQTIAIVDAYDDPNIAADLAVFDQTFGLPAPPSFIKVNQYGSASGPMPAVNASWAGEIALDVEWAHTIAPAAKILLVEAKSTSLGDLVQAINTARNWVGVTTVSMSWGGSEFAQESLYNSYLTTPAGHPGVTFVAATLDNGAYYGNYWPAISPNVLAVGGTTLTLNADNTWSAETGWAYGGGGVSRFLAQPSYQKGLVTQTTTRRANPDVAYGADPNTGFAVYDTVPYGGQTGWFLAGGTSAGTPQWAALVAIANQGRAANGLPALDGPGQTLPGLYQLARTNWLAYFHDITTGNNGYSAGPGFDLVTGLGSPHADTLIQAMLSITGSGSTVRFNTATSSQANSARVQMAALVFNDGMTLTPVPAALLTAPTNPSAVNAAQQTAVPAPVLPPPDTTLSTPAPLPGALLPGGSVNPYADEDPTVPDLPPSNDMPHVAPASERMLPRDFVGDKEGQGRQIDAVLSELDTSIQESMAPIAVAVTPDAGANALTEPRRPMDGGSALGALLLMLGCYGAVAGNDTRRSR